MPIVGVALHSDVPLELLESELDFPIERVQSINTGSKSSEADKGNQCLVVYLTQEPRNRVELRLRTTEGKQGTLQAFVMPHMAPKTSQVCSFRIRPLSHHQRVQSIDDGVPLSELKVSGGFTLAEIHAWVCFCLPDVPPRPPGDEVSSAFVSCTISTVLMCQYRQGEATFKSDNISTLSILKEAIFKEATSHKVRVSISFELNDKVVPHFLEIVYPRLKDQLSLLKRCEMLEALKELKAQDDDLSFLDSEFEQILRHSEAILMESRRQGKTLRNLHNVIKDFFVDWNKFKGYPVKHLLPQLDLLLRGADFGVLLGFLEKGH